MAAFPIVKTPEDKEASPDNVTQLLVVPVDCKNWLAVPEVNLDKEILLAFKIAVILPAEYVKSISVLSVDEIAVLASAWARTDE